METLDQINKELKEKYGFPRVCEIFGSRDIAMSHLYTSKIDGYYAEPFVVDVLNDWNDLGVTLISCGDNSMGQWVDAVLQPDLTAADFADPNEY